MAKIGLILSFIGLALSLAVLLAGCTNDDGAVGALLGAGYSEVKLTGWNCCACGKDDTCTGFEAKGPTGRIVTGAVGCGFWAKGCTIRIAGVR
jgi:hypothetical protein